MVERTSSSARGADATTPPSYSHPTATPAATDRDVTSAAELADVSGIDFSTDIVALAELKQKIGNYDESDELFRSAIAQNAATDDSDATADVPALKGLVANQLLRGNVDTADDLVQELITAAQDAGDNPAIVLALNELVRLSLSSSAYTVAEPLLLCLLEIKRGKGADRPEFATVLASLAAVRQGMGQHESAEKMWRDVVAIRERTLPPNHFAITSALEHLATACAARGNLTEAVQLFQRAHTMRALTLGLEHPSLRFSRERIADLQLQADEIAHLDTSVSQSLPLEREVAPPVVNEIVAQPSVISEEPRAAAATIAPPATMVRYREMIPPMPTAIEISHSIESLGNRTASLIALGRDQIRMRYKAVLGVLGVVSVLIIAQAAGSRGPDKRNEISARPAHRAITPAPAPAASPTPSFFTAREPAPEVVARSTPPANAARADTDRSAPKAEKNRDEERARPKKESHESEQVIAVPTACGPRNGRGCLPTDLGARVGEIADANSARNVGAALEKPIADPTFAPERAARTNDAVDAGSAVVAAVLIGGMPALSYPKSVNDMDGEVRVRFNVGTNGRPVMSSFSVIESTHPAFTAAVRDAVQRMRFEPARSGPEGKAVVDAVEIPFRFTRPRR